MSEPQGPLEQFDPNLHRRMEAKARREFEAAESEAALLAARRRRLADVAWEAAQSGRRVRIRVGQREVSGIPIYSRHDLMSMETLNGRVEVCIPNVDALQVLPGSVEGQSVVRDVETFAARIGMIQLAREHVEIVCRGGEASFHGRIQYVARDHLALTATGGTAFVTLGAIAYIIRRPPVASSQ